MADPESTELIIPGTMTGRFDVENSEHINRSMTRKMCIGTVIPGLYHPRNFGKTQVRKISALRRLRTFITSSIMAIMSMLRTHGTKRQGTLSVTAPLKIC